MSFIRSLSFIYETFVITAAVHMIEIMVRRHKKVLLRRENQPTMLEFTKHIRAGESLRAFHFQAVLLINGVGRLHVTVEDGSGQQCYFTMALRFGLWHIIDAPKVPGWIHQLGKSLSAAIVEEGAQVHLQQAGSEQTRLQNPWLPFPRTRIGGAA